MELRNGVYTSRSRKNDAESIERLARQIRQQFEGGVEPDLAAIERAARKIESEARSLARDL